MIICSDGKPCETEAEAKAHELASIKIRGDDGMAPELAAWIVEHAKEIIAILQAKPSKRKPRKDKGGHKVKPEAKPL